MASAAEPEIGHFHHVRLNVRDVEATRAFYAKVFGAVPVQFNGRTPGLFTERSFILMNQVPEAPRSNLATALWHIGWAGVDGPNEYAWWKQQGVEFHTPVTPLGTNHYMYLYGPDREIIEIYTGDKHHRFNHVHVLASDPRKTASWLMQALALPGQAMRDGLLGTSVRVDDVQIIVFPDSERFRPKERSGTPLPTDDSAIAHVAFSFRNLETALERMRTQQVEIVHPIRPSELHGLRSFFARAPDGILIEFVEARPIPDGLWE
jgi:catechol 2,3-dioxygenase-like lactoylglutathione lyase family enzyme